MTKIEQDEIFAGSLLGLQRDFPHLSAIDQERLAAALTRMFCQGWNCCLSELAKKKIDLHY